MNSHDPLITYDADVHALYIQFTTANVRDTIELTKGVYLDLDANNQPVGFEILNADAGFLASVPTLLDAVALSALLKSRAT